MFIENFYSLEVTEENQESSVTPKAENAYPTEFTVYLPENLDLNRLLEENPPTSISLNNVEFIKDNIAYILHLINYLPITKKDYDYEENDGYVPINKKKLQSMGIHNYKEYITYLENCNVIHVGTRYIVGEQSRGIKFTNIYAFSKVITYTIKKKTLLKAIFKNKQEFIDLAQNEYPYLNKWWDVNKIHIDYERAKTYLDEKLERDQQAFFDKYQMTEAEYLQEQINNKRRRRRDKTKYPTYQYNSAFILIHRLHEKEYFMKVDETAGRYHTIFTQLPKELKQFVTFDGNQLVGIDLTNSQPLLATALLDKDIFVNNPILMETIQRFNPFYQEQQPTMLDELIEENENKPDVLNYKRIVENGQFYEQFGELLRQNGLIPEDIKDAQEIRSLAKTTTFASFFASNFDYWHIKAIQHFHDTFPNVYNIFSKIKYVVKGTKKKDKVHKALSVSLQALEAEIFLKKISLRISISHPDIPIFTIHDSIVTTEGNQELVKRFIEEAIFEAIQVEPIIKIEHW
jgi:hypothetical protein